MNLEDLKKNEKVKPAGLGMRIGIVFFIALGMLVFAAYIVIARNVQSMLTDYTLQLLQSMVVFAKRSLPGHIAHDIYSRK